MWQYKRLGTAQFVASVEKRRVALYNFFEISGSVVDWVGTR